MEITAEMIRQEAKECDARKVAQARQMSGAEKLRAGVELFESACEVTLAGIRFEHPEWSPDRCLAELRKRVALL